MTTTAGSRNTILWQVSAADGLVTAFFTKCVTHTPYPMAAALRRLHRYDLQVSNYAQHDRAKVELLLPEVPESSAGQ
ncbi:MAG: hypothetical protein H6964_15120 [Chromatiaceae bacterium]|nr:hypothetical protein [Gammaproteobacteria bacterium]MCB1873111.1 hypothetical protein [Gammaproteobacteria bacterium]MCB1879730.1 hypothetical protein [Gammaproteobacteria bacterium]MCP5448305.1 hypothetical protein [Chromatiaceae bacterium]